MKTYIYHTDAGHGWIAVKRAELLKLGILHKITGFSYQQGKTVYLEEDCDASTFVAAMEKAGTPVNVANMRESYHDRSPVRSYSHFYLSDNDLQKMKPEHRQEYVNYLRAEQMKAETQFKAGFVKQHKQDYINYYQHKLDYMKDNWNLEPSDPIEQESVEPEPVS